MNIEEKKDNENRMKRKIQLKWTLKEKTMKIDGKREKLMKIERKEKTMNNRIFFKNYNWMIKKKSMKIEGKK